MLITFLKEVMCVASGLNTRRRAPNYFDIIQTPNTLENRHQITRHNLSIFTRVLSAPNRLKIRIFSLGREIQNPYKKKEITVNKKKKKRCTSSPSVVYNSKEDR